MPPHFLRFIPFDGGTTIEATFTTLKAARAAFELARGATCKGEKTGPIYVEFSDDYKASYVIQVEKYAIKLYPDQ